MAAQASASAGKPQSEMGRRRIHEPSKAYQSYGFCAFYAALNNQNSSLKRPHLAMGHNLCLHFGADEQPCTTYFDVHQGYRILTHNHLKRPEWLFKKPTAISLWASHSQLS